MIYSSLHPKRREFRLLTLKKAAKRDPIQCSLFGTSLDSPPPYEALSYAWGSHDQSSRILINGQDFNVTQNLNEALEQLRLEREDRTIWVDAICINQDDIPERNAQVAQMKTIYNKARRVIVWLGKEAEDSDIAMQLLMELKDRNMDQKWIEDTVGSSALSKPYLALAKMLLRPYWYRLWIVQEIAFARDAVLHCGALSISYSAVEDFSETFDTVFQKFDYDHKDPVRILSIRTSIGIGGPSIMPKLGAARYSTRTPLLNLLIEHRDKISSDPRDKLFGLIGMSNLNTSSKDGTVIDYSRSVSEVYKKLVQVVVEETNELDIICCSSNVSSNQGWVEEAGPVTVSLPSWAPNWSQNDKVGLIGHDEYSAAGGKFAEARFSEDLSVLNVRGFCVGSVNFLGGPADFDQTEISNETSSAVLSCVLGWRRILKELSFNDSAEGDFYRMLMLQPADTSIDTSFSKKMWGDWHEDAQMAKPITINSMQIAVLAIIRDFIQGRRFFMSFQAKDGRQYSFKDCFDSVDPYLIAIMGLIPNAARPDDLICILFGCNYPVTLRREDDHYIVVGVAFANGLMDGQAMRQLAEGRYKLQEFALH